jgi:parallel beta-helix repeat protein
MGVDLVRGTIRKSNHDLLFQVKMAHPSPTGELPTGFLFSWAFGVGKNEYRIIARAGNPAEGSTGFFAIEGNCGSNQQVGPSCEKISELEGRVDSKDASFTVVVPLQVIGAREGSTVAAAKGPAADLCQVCWTAGVDGVSHPSLVADDAEIERVYTVPHSPQASKDQGGGTKQAADKTRSGSKKQRVAKKRRGARKCRGVKLRPSVNLQRALNRRPKGTRFCLRPGVYRIREALVPKARQKLIGVGKRPTVISGAKRVKATKAGRYWVITGQRSVGTSRNPSGYSPCRSPGGPDKRDPEGMCVRRDQVLLNNVQLWQVNSLSKVRATSRRFGTGTFYWDYATNKIFIADNPRGRKLEVTATGNRGIFGAGVPGVRIRNLVVEKFGNQSQSGAVHTGRNWVVAGSEIRLNHGGGVHQGPGTVLRNNYIHHNGQLGIAGGQEECSFTEGIVAVGNEVAHNNTAGYNWTWEGGATKWVYTDGLIIRNNHVHHNYGMGIWIDWGLTNTLIEGNVSEDNYGEGIVMEAAASTVVRNNIVRRNGHMHPVTGNVVYGAGILIAISPDTEVYDNVVEDNKAGITAHVDPRLLTICDAYQSGVRRTRVHENVIRQPSGIAAGLQRNDVSDASFYDPQGNRWFNNRYLLGAEARFWWINPDVQTWEQWTASGQDEGSTVDSL